MRLCRLEPGGRATVVESDAPAPGPGEALVRFTGALVDETTLQAYQAGSLTSATSISGEVLQVGPDVIGWKTSQAVAGCYVGPLADYLVLPVAQLLSRPQLMSADALLCPIALALKTLRRAGMLPDATAVVGGGFLGLCQVALMKATTPWLVGQLPEALELAVELGASQSLEFAQSDLGALFEKHPIELILESSGRTPNRELASQLVASGGTVIFAGVGKGSEKFDCTRLHYEQLPLTAIPPLTSDDLEAAETRLGELPDSMVTASVGLEEFPSVLERMAQGVGISYLLQGEQE